MVNESNHMDPWKSTDSFDLSTSDNSFEDNFKPTTFDEKLPDSLEYLAALNKRLEKIKTDPDLVKQLTEKREACMQHLLRNSTTEIDHTEDLDSPIEDSALLRTLAPQRQAINRTELVELLKYDQLVPNIEETEKESD